MRIFIISLLLCVATSTFGQIDIQSYHIRIAVSDTSDIIRGNNTIELEFTEICDSFFLDLKGQNEGGTGMRVFDVFEIGKQSEIVHVGIDLDYRQSGDQLIIYPQKIRKGERHTYSISYNGIPADGLVIGTNKFNERTFFGDNWPNRASNWFPCIDHPSDKASVSYTVFAPSKYRCIANGKFIRSTPLSEEITETIYESDIPLPTKVMVIGLAEFEVKELENEHGFPHTIWAYKQDKENGFSDMSVAPDPLNFFIENVAPYPYEKLANVQSTTRFGGMENAGCIFYDEDAVKGEGSMENLIAHEIAHQWFGNSASESDWPHIWLSEGFATYFTSLHLEHKYGRARMNEQLIKDRDRVIKFSHSYLTPVIDTVSTNLMYFLNPNSYQKGCWVLHMLRNKIGDDHFWNGIRAYYDTYKYSNASSNDFIAIMEKETGIELNSFFDQWLRKSGHPVLKASLHKGHLRIIQQQVGHVFTFPLEVEFEDADGKKIQHTFQINERTESFEINQLGTITSFKLDPNINLLFENVE